MCPEAGGPIQFPGFNGKDALPSAFTINGYFLSLIMKGFPCLCVVGELICPADHELCGSVQVPVHGQCPSSCNFNGDCIDGKCHCFLGFYGNDCTQRK